MADKDIKISIKTKADTSGVDKADASVKKFNAEIARTENTSAGLKPLEGRIERLGRTAANASGGMSNLGNVINQIGYQATDFAVQVQNGTSAITAFSQQAPQAIGAITMLGTAGATAGALFSASVPPLTAVSIIITALAAGYKMVADAVGKMTGAQDEATKAEARSVEQKELMLEQQQKLREEEARSYLAGHYAKQAEELERQLRAIERINQLRGELNNIEQQRANQEITIAKQRGGDVALAESNAIAVQLRTGLEALNGNLGQAQQRAFNAQKRAEEASSAYQTAINTNATAEQIEELGTLKGKAETDAQDAKQEFADTTQKVTAQRGQLLTDVEIKLTEKESEYAGKTSAAANKGFQGVYDSLKKAVAEGPQATITQIDQIKVNADTITTAATNKKTEVEASLNTERTNTVQAIQQLAPTPQDTAAITTALDGLSTAISQQGSTVASAIKQVMEAMEMLQKNDDTVKVILPAIIKRIAENEKEMVQIKRDVNS